MTDQHTESRNDTAATSPRRFEPVRLAGPGVTRIDGEELRRALHEIPGVALSPGHIPAEVPVASEETVAARLEHGQVSAADMMTYPFSSIGRIMARPKSGGTFQGVCTGVLVGPDMVLTATHLLRDYPLAEFTFRFIPGYHDGARANAPDGHFRTSSLFTGEVVNGNPTGSVHGDHVGEIVNGFDFSIFRLVHRLGDHWGHLGTITNNGSSFYEDRAWKSVGYPVVLNGGRFPIQSPIDVADVETDDYGSREIETESLIGGSILGPGVNWDGWSGGPLLTFYNGGWWVGGVMSGWDLDGPLDFDGVHVFAGGPRLGVVMDLAYRQFGHTSGWSQWFGLGGQCAAVSVVRADNATDIYVAGTDGQLYQKWWDGQRWNPSDDGFAFLGGLQIKPGSLSLIGGDRFRDVYAIGTDNQLYHRYWDGNWSPWFGLGGQCAAVSVVRADNATDIYVAGTDGQLYQKWWDGQRWNPSDDGFAFLGGLQIKPGSLSVIGGDRFRDVYAIGTDNQLYHRYWDGNWSPWFGLGGQCAAVSVVRADNATDIYVTGTDGQLYQKWWDGQRWNPSDDGFAFLGGLQIKPGSLSVIGGDRFRDVYAIATDNQLYHRYYQGL